MKTYYILYDNIEKTYFEDVFETKEDAEKFKDAFLDAGNYYNHPHTCIVIEEYTPKQK